MQRRHIKERDDLSLADLFVINRPHTPTCCARGCRDRLGIPNVRPTGTPLAASSAVCWPRLPIPYAPCDRARQRLSHIIPCVHASANALPTSGMAFRQSGYSGSSAHQYLHFHPRSHAGSRALTLITIIPRALNAHRPSSVLPAAVLCIRPCHGAPMRSYAANRH